MTLVGSKRWAWMATVALGVSGCALEPHDPPAPEPPEPSPGPATTCAYPPPNADGYGVAVGSIVPGDYSWIGYAPGDDTPRRVTASEFHDCHGDKGVHAVLFDTAQYGCSACARQASELAEHIAAWEGLGYHIAVVTLLLDGPGDGPASAEGAALWRSEFDLEGVYVLSDPEARMVPGPSLGTPQTSVVDPRTMQVTYLEEGYSGNYPTLLNVAARNAALAPP